MIATPIVYASPWQTRENASTRRRHVLLDRAHPLFDVCRQSALRSVGTINSRAVGTLRARTWLLVGIQSEEIDARFCLWTITIDHHSPLRFIDDGSLATADGSFRYEPPRVYSVEPYAANPWPFIPV